MSKCAECGKEYVFDCRDVLMCISGMCMECIRKSLDKSKEELKNINKEIRGKE